jgi:hypothetical protein
MMLAPTRSFAILEPAFFNANTYEIHKKAKKTLTHWVLLDPPGYGVVFCANMKGFLYPKMHLPLIGEALFFSSAGNLGVHHG